MPKRILVDFAEEVVEHKAYLSEFSWTTPLSIMHFYCLTPATGPDRLKRGIMFSPRTVLKTFVDEIAALDDAEIFVSEPRWEVISTYLTSFGLPVPTNRVYRMDLDE